MRWSVSTSMLENWKEHTIISSKTRLTVKTKHVVFSYLGNSIEFLKEFSHKRFWGNFYFDDVLSY